MNRLFLCMVVVFAFMGIASDSAFAAFPNISGTEESLFPVPQNTIIETIARNEDQVVFLFRERMKAQNSLQNKENTVLNNFLVRGLDRWMRTKSIELRNEILRDREDGKKRLRQYFTQIKTGSDRAAFSFFFAKLPRELASLKDLAELSKKAVEDLSAPGALAKYVDTIAATADFFRKTPIWVKIGDKIADKVDILVIKLESFFALENLILAADWVSRKSDGCLQTGADQLIKRLSARLLIKIREDLAADLEIGMEPEMVSSVIKYGNGYMTQSVLYRGRMRFFIKRHQLMNVQQKKLFAPIFRSVQQIVESMIPSQTDKANQVSLKAMKDNLEMMAMMEQIKAKTGNNQAVATNPAEISMFEKIEELFKRCNTEAILAESR